MTDSRTHLREKPSILGRRVVAKTGVFTVEELSLRFSNGSERRYERIAGGRQDSVLVVPILDRDTVLLVREYAAAMDRYELGLPKGRITADEDPLAAANREIREEIGYAATELELLRPLTLAPAYIDHRTQIVMARGLMASPLPGDEPEPPEVVPWKLTRLEELLARADFSEARSVAALFIVRDLLRATPEDTLRGASPLPDGVTPTRGPR